MWKLSRRRLRRRDGEAPPAERGGVSFCVGGLAATATEPDLARFFGQVRTARPPARPPARAARASARAQGGVGRQAGGGRYRVHESWRAAVHDDSETTRKARGPRTAGAGT